MKAFSSRLASISIAAAGVFAAAGAAQADNRHHHAYAHLSHTHTYNHSHGSFHSNAQGLGNAIIVGGLLLGGIALLDALSDGNGQVNVTTTTNLPTSNGPVVTWTPPSHRPPVVFHPTNKPDPAYTTRCRDHGHISVQRDAKKRFSLRRPDGSVLEHIRGGRPLQRRIANALDAFGIDTTCVIQTDARRGKEKTRLFLANGRLPRVPMGWTGADAVGRINPDNLTIARTGEGFAVQRRSGSTLAKFDTRAGARAFIDYLDRMNARKRVVFKHASGDTRFVFYAR